jgi:hypothetical protein
MFTPCLNISMAARQIAQLVDRCKTAPPFGTDPIHCATAAYRGTWEHPDNKFADAVQTSVAKDDARNFDMPDDSHIGSGEVAPEAAVAGPRAFTTPPNTLDDQQQGWSSALFPARSQQFGRVSTNKSSNSRVRIDCKSSASSARIRRPQDCVKIRSSCADCLSGGRNDGIEPGSHDFACWRAFGSETGERRPTDRTMAR